MSSHVKYISAASNITQQFPGASVYRRLVDLLSQSKGNFNKRNRFGETPLILATLEGSLSTVELLVESGADIDLPDSKGFTPLMYAILKNREDIMGYLLDLGVDAGLKNNQGKDVFDLRIGQLAMKSIVENMIKEQIRRPVECQERGNRCQNTGKKPVISNKKRSHFEPWNQYGVAI